MRMISGILLSAIVVLSCGEGQENPKGPIGNPVSTGKTKDQNLNISVFLDVSDRIDTVKYPNKAMEYYQRDIGYIGSVADAFALHLRQKRLQKIDDKMQVFFDPTPQDGRISGLSQRMKCSFTKDNITKEKMNSYGTQYREEAAELYKLAVAQRPFVGSDIWAFFQNRVKDYCIESGYRNILVVLTDGFVYHKNNKRKEGNLSSYVTPEELKQNKSLNGADWKNYIDNSGVGLIPATKDLENLEILVVGLDAHNIGPYGSDVLNAIWSKWLGDMGVKNVKVLNADLPVDLDPVLRGFILN